LLAHVVHTDADEQALQLALQAMHVPPAEDVAVEYWPVGQADTHAELDNA